MDSKKRSSDPAAQQMLEKMAKAGQENVWDRSDQHQPRCGFGSLGICCRICNMGPCRIDPFGEGPTRGVCGATAETIIARNFIRACAAGASAHSDHGRGVAEVFHMAANEKSKDYTIKDEVKLREVAQCFDIKVEGRSKKEIAQELAEKALAEFGKSEGELYFPRRAPKKRQELWKELGIWPRAIDREIVEALHRSHMGVDQDYKNIIKQASRLSLGDGWGGSMIATELQDIMFGTPVPVTGQVNLGVMKEDEVNIVVHGHEPILSEMIVAASQLPEMKEKARAAGAKDINLCGICCTSNEMLMRHGMPIAGNFLHQELAISTGAVDAMVVDVQCIMQGLDKIADCYHTKLVTTTAKGRMPGVQHLEFDEHDALKTAKEILTIGIDNYKNRGKISIPTIKSDVVYGFTHETIKYMLGGRFRASYRPLNDNIINGRIRGIAAIVGCNNPQYQQDWYHTTMAKEFIKRDVLVVTTGCGQIACGKVELLQPEAALQYAGPGLREVCEAVGIPPVLACGSCVDNSRLLVACSEIVAEGGLGEDLSDLPVAGACLEAMSEKAIAIGQYFVASGVLVVFNQTLPVLGSPIIKKYLFEEIEEELGGKWAIETDPVKAVDLMCQHIEKKRDALGINVEAERKLYDMEARRELVF
jgi:carbon-monoxide dehydrogenase catalytic subunit